MSQHEPPIQAENPYAAPIASTLAAPDRTSNGPITHEELRAFFGLRAERYLGSWRRMISGSGAGLNWAALLLTPLWLAYRKMYKVTIIFYVFMLVESVLEQVIFAGALAMEPPQVLNAIIGLIVSTVCGALGNRWYLSHARNVISQVRSLQLPGDAHLQTLARRGGTSLLTAIGMFIAWIAALGAAMSILEVIFTGLP